MNKLINGLSCLALLFIINCDNEQPNPPTSPSFKKAVARLGFFDSSDTGISFDKWEKIKKVRLSISTDEKGDTPAKYYKDMNDLTGKDLTNVIFPIKESEIQVLLEATKEGKDYYIQNFNLLDDEENILYFGLKTHFKLKSIDNQPIKVDVVSYKSIDPIPDRVTPEFSVRCIDNQVVGFEFQNYNNHYFDQDAEIDLKLSYNNNVIFDYKDIFAYVRSISFTDIYFTYGLGKERSSYTGDFQVEATVHDYPIKGVTHDFIILEDVSDQIRKGKLLLRVSNHPPKLLVNNGKNSIQINLAKTTTEVNIPLTITDQDSDETQYDLVCQLAKKSNPAEVVNLVLNKGFTIFKTGSSISFSTDKLKTKEGQSISQDDLQNYQINIFSIISDRLYYSHLIKTVININPKTAD